MTEASRIKPPMGHDNAWWWEMAQQGQLGIQRCLGCATLRHPPRPMCGDCHSLEWDAVQACGRGTICSYTILTHLATGRLRAGGGGFRFAGGDADS